MTQPPRLLVLVPAFNEEETVAAVVADARGVLGADVVVIDDGSADATGEAAFAAGATVLVLPFNLGVGGAIRAGLRFAAEQSYDRTVQLDADGQHHAAEAKQLLARLDAGDADVVVGSRFAAGYEVSRGRRLMMRLLSRIVTRRLGVRITDTTSGFRALSRPAIETFAQAYPVDYLSDTVEALLLAGDSGLRVVEVDVAMQQRLGGVPSSRSLKSSYHLVRVLLAILVDGLRPRSGHDTLQAGHRRRRGGQVPGGGS